MLSRFFGTEGATLPRWVVTAALFGRGPEQFRVKQVLRMSTTGAGVVRPVRQTGPVREPTLVTTAPLPPRSPHAKRFPGSVKCGREYCEVCVGPGGWSESFGITQELRVPVFYSWVGNPTGITEKVSGPLEPDGEGCGFGRDGPPEGRRYGGFQGSGKENEV